MENAQSEQSMLVERAGKEESNGKREIIPIDETPFQMVNMEENGWYLVIGNEVMKIMERPEELIDYVNSKPWELMLNAGYLYNKAITKIDREEE